MGGTLLDFLNILIPEWVIVILAVLALITAWNLARSLHKIGAVIFMAACANFILIYVWIWIANPSLTERAIGVRMAVSYVLLSIAFYSLRETGTIDKYRNVLKRIILRKIRRGENR